MGLFLWSYLTMFTTWRFDCISNLCVENLGFCWIFILTLIFVGNTQTNVMCSSEVPGLPNSKKERTYQIVVRKSKETSSFLKYIGYQCSRIKVLHFIEFEKKNYLQWILNLSVLMSLPLSTISDTRSHARCTEWRASCVTRWCGRGEMMEWTTS